jgi:hypothetical protein
MNFFYAPYALSDNSLEESIRMIAAIKSRTMVINRNNEHYLFTSKTIFENYAEKNVNWCHELDFTTAIPIGDLTANASMLQDNIAYNGNLASFFDSLMDERALDYGFLYPDRNERSFPLVLVFARHAGTEYSIVSSNTICVCTGPNRHLSYNEAVNGTECPCLLPNIYHCTDSQ